MAVYALRQVRALAARLLEHVVAAYDAAVHLVEEHLAPVLPRLSDLAANDDHGVLLEQTQNLLRGRDLLLSEDAANRLVDAPLDQGNKVVELVRQTVGTRMCPLRSEERRVGK